MAGLCRLADFEALRTLAGRPQEVVPGAGFELRGKGDVIRVVVVLPARGLLGAADSNGGNGGSEAEAPQRHRHGLWKDAGAQVVQARHFDHRPGLLKLL